MVHGGPKSFGSSGRWRVVVACFAVCVAVSGAGGPVDSAIPSRNPDPVLLARRASLRPPIAAPALSDSQIPSLNIAVVSKLAKAELLYDLPTKPPVVVAATQPVPASAKKQRVLAMDVTAYCACKKCCGEGAMGITASGRRTTYNGGHFIAADRKVLPFGTKVIVPGYAEGKVVEVIDRGGAIRGNHIDVFMANHKDAVAWGKKKLQVTVVE